MHRTAVEPALADDWSFDELVERLLPLARLRRERDSLRAAYLAAKPYRTP